MKKASQKSAQTRVLTHCGRLRHIDDMPRKVRVEHPAAIPRDNFTPRSIFNCSIVRPNADHSTVNIMELLRLK